MPDNGTPGQKASKTAASSNASGAGPAPAARAAPGAPTVLVVDDDDDIRAMLVRALGTKYTVYEARDGLEAREVIEGIPVPDAIVTDVMMPRLDGIAFAKLVRKEAALQRVPILFLTARGSPVDVITGINAGARHYVTKPFKIGDVLAKVATMIRKQPP
ncbi:MAG TPA: response regulator [Polyangiaceae bacterium]|nr:response regulator [Polyangiaceae bacterium]